MDQVNLKSLAKALGLSVSTVSRALSDSYQISEETKKRVFALAKQLNYQPNPYASSLRNRSSKTIAIIIPEIANNFFLLAINGIEEIAQANGYHVLIYITHESNAKEIAYCRHLLSGRVDGVLMSMSGEVSAIDHLNALTDNEIPIVFFDRICEAAETYKVTTNDYECGYLATQHLIDQGCTKIAYLGLANAHSIGKKRLKGYQDALTESGIAINDTYMLKCGSDKAENLTNIKQLLTANNAPDGIFASVEELALLSYEVCHAEGIKIPGRVKIIGFSNLRTAPLLDPPLTTITQPAFEIGNVAAKALFGLLTKRPIDAPDGKLITLPSTLIERRSTQKTKQGS